MIAQELYLPLTFSKKDNVNNSTFINDFLKEAIQILKHAHHSLSEETEEEEEIPEHEDAVTWQLSLTPTAMTLNTSICTVSGLEKVLELIRINVKPLPPKFKDSLKKKLNNDQLDISLFRKLLEPVLRLSTVTQPHSVIQYQAPLIKHCIYRFIECGYGFFLDGLALLSQLDQPNIPPTQTLLILSICSIMVRHTTLHHRGDIKVAQALSHTFYSQARQLLQDLFDVPDIAVVQSLFLLSVYPQGHTYLLSPARLPSPLLTMAIRLALAIDLHQHSTLEYNKRLAWMIFCADYYSDWHATGQTGLIEVTNWHVDFPQPLPHETQTKRPVELFSQTCRILLIRKLELFRSSYLISLTQRGLACGRLEDQLFQSYFNTPEDFRIDWDKPDLESLLLHELYSHTQILAQLPFLPVRYFQERPDQTTEVLELHCVVNLLTVLNQYTLILESLAKSDQLGCFHNPLYGLTLTGYLYLLIDQQQQLPSDFHTVCQSNLLRTFHLLRRAKLIYQDQALGFLELKLSKHPLPNDQHLFRHPSEIHDLILSLKSVFLKNL